MNTNNPDNDYPERQVDFWDFHTQLDCGCIDNCICNPDNNMHPFNADELREANEQDLIACINHQRQPANFTIPDPHEELLTQTYDMFEEGIEWRHYFDEDGNCNVAAYGG